MNKKLCYIEGNKLYFTDAPLEKQWGDDWDDAPYEHNAGEPYDDENITTAYVEDSSYSNLGMLITPCYGHQNSPYSVEDINLEKKIPWLRIKKKDNKNQEYIDIYAGASLEEVIQVIRENGGKIYTEYEEKAR